MLMFLFRALLLVWLLLGNGAAIDAAGFVAVVLSLLSSIASPKVF